MESNTLRIGISADWHIEPGMRQQRIRALNRLVAGVGERKPDLFLLPGDLFDHESTPEDRWALAGILENLAEHCPVYGCEGNHEQHDDLAVFNYVTNRERSHHVRIWTQPAGILPGTAHIERLPGGQRVGILACPWFDKANVGAHLPAEEARPEAVRLETINAAETMLRCFYAEAQRVKQMKATPIFIGHLMVAGSDTSTGQRLIGQTVELAPAAVAGVGAAFHGLGHIHLRQGWLDNRVLYPGSPDRITAGETDEKSWTLIEIETTEPFAIRSVEHIPLPSPAIHKVEIDMAAGEDLQGRLRELASTVLRGDHIRVRILRRPDQADSVNTGEIEADLRRIFLPTSLKVATEVQRAERAVRSDRIVGARGLEEKLEALWETEGGIASHLSRETVLTNAAELQRG